MTLSANRLLSNWNPLQWKTQTGASDDNVMEGSIQDYTGLGLQGTSVTLNCMEIRTYLLTF